MALTTINSDGVKDDSIVNADIKSDAAIAGSKIAPDFGSQNIITTGSVHINGTPAWTETGGDYGNLSIRGTTSSSSGFINLGNGAAATNSGFDLARIKIHNGATEVARITGITGDGNNDSGELWFATQASGGSLTTALVIDKDQKVGIKTTSPIVALDVNGEIALPHNNTIRWHDSGSTRVDMYGDSSNNLIIRNNSGNAISTLSSAGNLTLTGNLVVASGKGIDFSAQTGTQESDSATGGTGAELLNHYEEGTWTPTLTSGTGSNSCSYSNQNGYFTRVGNLVHIDFYVNFSNGSFGGSGTRLNGLPFSALNWGAGSVFLHNWNFQDDAANIICHTSGNTTLYLYVTRDNGSWQELENTTSGQIIGACTYRTGAA